MSSQAEIYWPYTGVTDLGDCVCLRLCDDDGKMTGVHVEKADPRVLIAGELLDQFHEQMMFGSLRCAGTPDCPIGDVFAIDGVNQRVVYVVTRHGPTVPEWSTFVAEWPD